MNTTHTDDNTQTQKNSRALPQTDDSGNSTIFDDVFRTIAQKMPFLLIPLINEVFRTNYSDEQKFEQLRNEHYEKFGKVVTDSIIRIDGHTYHIECQSTRDGNIAIRMMEYDFAIALEDAFLSDKNRMDVYFPESCVLYIRNHRNMPNHHEVCIHFADGQSVVYRVPVILAADYTVNLIFEKRLLLLLPYHILRYEAFLKANRIDEKKMQQLLTDYRDIHHQLSTLQETDNKAELYVDLIELINQIADYVIPRDNPSRERIGEVMGGKILKLKSEILREEGIAIGRTEGRTEGRAEGRTEGESRVNQLNACLLSEKRFDDLARAVNDREYQAALYKEYGL